MKPEDKKLCRELIYTGLERECKQFVNEMKQIANLVVPEDFNQSYQEIHGRHIEGPWHKRFIEIHNLANDFNQHIAERYDGMSGSRYINCVIGLYLDQLITDEEISRFSEEIQTRINNIVSPHREE